MPFIAEDVVRFVPDDGRKKPFNLYWGEKINVTGHAGRRTQVQVLERSVRPIAGSIRGRLPTQDTRPLQFMMIDVQQGDGMIMITPAGQTVMFDGGDNKLFARFAANRFRGTTADRPFEIDCMIISHGDADHFQGLSEIRKSESNSTARKRLFMHPKRVYHNGLVKGPGTKNRKRVKDEKMFGSTVGLRDGGLAVVALEEDLTRVNPKRFNRPFKQWVSTLKHWQKRGPIEFKRLAAGNRREFNFLRSEGIDVDVLGPVERTVTFRGRRRKALDFFRVPPKDANLAAAGFDATDRRFSASHTINGQSVSLRIRYGNVRFMMSGDLNNESMAALNRRYSKRELQSEILKVPHHGSADFDLGMLRKISPVVSLISSGDESSRKEHIHPRATLMGALGRIARSDTSLVFCTELAAFFEYRGLCRSATKPRPFHGFERTNFGIVHIRTDGERVLVFTHSGKDGMNEAYRFTVDSRHRVKMAKNIRKR